MLPASNSRERQRQQIERMSATHKRWIEKGIIKSAPRQSCGCLAPMEPVGLRADVVFRHPDTFFSLGALFHDLIARLRFLFPSSKR